MENAIKAAVWRGVCRSVRSRSRVTCTTVRVLLLLLLLLLLLTVIYVGVLRLTNLGSVAVEWAAGACVVVVSVDGESRCMDMQTDAKQRDHSYDRNEDVHGVYSRNEDIDAVYTWVDPLEKVWRHQKHALVHGFAYIPDGSDLSDARRFNNGKYPEAELCASLDLLLVNMPWIRHVWVLTARPQQPTCAHPQMRIVHHDEVGLPATFNSVSIETSVHKIPGLSARFVYLNDDVYVLRPIPVSAFFAADGRPIVWTEPFGVSHLFRTCARSCEATNRLVKPLLRGKSMLHLLHGPRALTVDILNTTVSLPSLARAVHQTTFLHLTRRYDDFLIINAALSLAVAAGAAVLSTAVPTLRMVDGIQTTPFHRHVDLACVNGAILDTASDVARLRASLRLKQSSV